MAGFLDTSVLVRYLIQESNDLTDQAARIIETVEDLRVTDVVVAETAYVLSSVYGVPREVVVDHLVDLLNRENVSVFGLDKGLVLQALLFCRPSGRVSFADAMVWAAARSAGSSVVYSLDERFPSLALEVHRTA